jgi:hypothetical protein
MSHRRAAGSALLTHPASQFGSKSGPSAQATSRPSRLVSRHERRPAPDPSRPPSCPRCRGWRPDRFRVPGTGQPLLRHPLLDHSRSPARRRPRTLPGAFGPSRPNSTGRTAWPTGMRDSAGMPWPRRPPRYIRTSRALKPARVRPRVAARRARPRGPQRRPDRLRELPGI